MDIEEDLIKKTIQGDPDSSKLLFSKLYDLLIPYFLKRGLNRFDSEDATQEVLIKLVKHFDNYMEKGKFKIFVFSIARNVFIDFLRKQKGYSLNVSDEFISLRVSEGNNIVKLEFLDVIANFSIKDQEIMILRFFYGFKIREISKIVEIPMRTVQSKIRKLSNNLKEQSQSE